MKYRRNTIQWTVIERNQTLVIRCLIFLWTLVFFLGIRNEGQANQGHNPHLIKCQKFLQADSHLFFSTQRLVFKTLSGKNSEEVISLLTMPEVTSMSGDPQSERDLHFILNIGRQTLEKIKSSDMSLVNWGVYAEGQFIGLAQISIGFDKSLIREGKLSDIEKWVSVGYYLYPDHWGQGYATEIIDGLIHFTNENLGADGIFAQVIPSNIGSIKALQKNHFKEIETSNKKAKTLLLRLREP